MNCKNNEYICQCYGVSAKDISKLLKKYHYEQVVNISNINGAGTGCGRCRSIIQQKIEETIPKYPDVYQRKLDL